MKVRMLFATLAVLLLVACNGTLDVGIEHSSGTTPSPTQPGTDTRVPTDTSSPTAVLPSPTASLAPSDTGLPVAASLASSNTPAPAATSTAAAIPATATYIDDRSTPSQVIVSYYNAINRREYARAYGYWSNPEASAGSFTTFANGYQDTALVDLAFGPISGDAGMSQVYYTVPVILKATARNGARTNYAACYIVHAVSQDVLSSPPAMPMGIDRGSATVSDIHASDASALATACSGFPAGLNPVAASGSSLSVDRDNYLDNRSGPVETVSSLLNAINRKEYVRAYSYFQDPATFPGPFDAYAAGYAGTDSITVTFGTAQSEGAAGSLYFKLPLALKALTTSGATQTFIGCYTLHLAQPANQTTPPFQPLGILGGTFTQVGNGSDVNALLPTACN